MPKGWPTSSDIIVSNGFEISGQGNAREILIALYIANSWRAGTTQQRVKVFQVLQIGAATLHCSIGLTDYGYSIAEYDHIGRSKRERHA